MKSRPFWFDREVLVWTVKRISIFAVDFYRAMHYSAKRGLAIACRLSVRLSVCNVGGS